MRKWMFVLAGMVAVGNMWAAGAMAPRFPDRGSWGLNIHTPFHEQALKECGVQWVRVGDRWNTGEPEKGKYDFTFARKLVEFYRAQNCNMIFVLDSETMNPAYADADTDAIIEALSNWHAALAAEFKGVPGIIWEIGNEPEVFTMNGRWNNAETYTKLARASARKIKAADPDALVGACSVAWVDRAFIDGALHAGLLEDGTIEYLTFHGYHRTGMQPESGLAADVTWMRSMVEKYQRPGHPVDIIDSERGYGILPEGREKHRDNWRNHTQGESEQAAYLARHFLEEIYLGIEVSIWYKDMFGEDSYSLYYGDEASGLRPMGRAYRNLSHLLPQNPRLIRNDLISSRLGNVPPDLSNDLAPYLRSYLIRKGDKAMLVVAAWFPVEAFDGKIIASRNILADGTMQERWRPVTPEDRISIPATVHVDAAKASVKSVSRFGLLAEEPGTLTPEDRVKFDDGGLVIGPVELTSTPDLWVIELE